MGVKQLSSASAITGSKSNKFWDQSTYVGDFVQIASAVVDSSGTPQIAFTNIPQNFTHLQLRTSSRDTNTSTGTPSLGIRFNGDTSASYNYHVFYGTGISSTATGSGATGYTYSYALNGTYDGNTASVYCANIVDFIDYSSSNKYKVTRTLTGIDYNTTSYSSYINFISTSWNNTAPISSMVIQSSTLHKQYSRFDLYGVR